MLKGFEGAWRIKPSHATPVPRLYFASATDSMAGSSPNTIAVAFSLRQTFPPALHRAQEAVRVLVRMRRLEPIEQLAAGAPRLGFEPCVQLFRDPDQRIGTPPVSPHLPPRPSAGRRGTA